MSEIQRPNSETRSQHSNKSESEYRTPQTLSDTLLNPPRVHQQPVPDIVYENVEVRPEQAQRVQQAMHERHEWRHNRPLPRIPIVTPINANTAMHNG
jgi:hypothetical protein